MKIHTELGSKKRLFEMMNNVNKIVLNEEFSLSQDNPNEAIILTVIEQLKGDTITITNSDSIKKGDGNTYVDLTGKDDQGNIVKLNFIVPTQEGEMDGVFSINDAILNGFEYRKSDGSEVISIDSNGLKNANDNHKDEFIEIASKYINVEDDSDEVTDELYEVISKKLDSYPFGGGSDRLQTGKRYGDEKPTNPKLRVKAPELDKFVSEDISSIDELPEEKRKIILQAHENLTSKMGRPEYSPNVHEIQDEIKKMNGINENLPIQVSDDKKDIIIATIKELKGELRRLPTREEVMARINKVATQSNYISTQVSDDKKNIIINTIKTLKGELRRLPTREEVMARINKSTMQNEGDYPDPIGKKFKPKTDYPKKKKKVDKAVKIGEGEKEEVEVGTEPEAPDVVNFDAEIGDEPNKIEPDFNAMGLEPEGIPDGGADIAMIGPNAPTPEDITTSFEKFNQGNNPDDINQLAQDKEEAGDMIQGGLADDKSPLEFCPKQITKGIEVEMEHTNNPLIAVELVMDHLVEDPEYYGTDDEDPEQMAQQGAKAEANDEELTDELLGYKSHNVGEEIDEYDYAAAEREYHDKEDYDKEDDELDGYEPQNVGDDEIVDEGFNSEFAVVFDGTSAYIEHMSNVSDDVEVLDKFDDIHQAKKYSDLMNNEIRSGDMNENEETEEYQGEVGDRYQDGEGNDFTVRNKVNGGVTLQGQGGEKEIATSDIQFLKKL